MLAGCCANLGVTCWLVDHSFVCAEKPINLKGVFERLVQTIEDKKTSDPLCIDAQEYQGAKIPTQCVVRSLLTICHALLIFTACDASI